MTKTPTAEEVLGLLSTACDSYNSEPFITAYQQWQAAQGPVTREWFVERFGSDYLRLTNSSIRLHYDNSIVVYYTWDSISRTMCVKSHPTRADIETIVRVLGGESCT